MIVEKRSGRLCIRISPIRGMKKSGCKSDWNNIPFAERAPKRRRNLYSITNTIKNKTAPSRNGFRDSLLSIIRGERYERIQLSFTSVCRHR